MALSPSIIFIICLVLILFFVHPTHAFGAGNIGSTSKIEGQNWRHGDIEDTLLTLLLSRAAGGKTFSKLDVKRVYFGNWLRDYSQAVDVGTVKYVSAEAIRILLWVLGFLSFGYGTKEFEVTTERLGCYRPEEHIDNPRGYANSEDARQYDPRLRGPVNERVELAIDPQTGLKNYIANEQLRIATSAGLVRNLFGRSIQLGRQYARSKREDDLFEALRLLGTGCHCLEDYSAHSNYTELALVEMGERGVFPHVGRQTQIQLRGARQSVYPIVTGTFGGTDFLHSVMGEFSDKATQSELQELEGTIQQSQNANPSLIRDLLGKIPSGIFGDEDHAAKVDELQQNAQVHQMQNARITPRKPEDWTRYLDDVQKQIYPILEWHDNIIKSITETIEKIPILPDLIEQLTSEINEFVFTLLAPFVLPIINQVKTELATGSEEIISSSKKEQLNTFYDDRATDPTHSMLSKDHFSNVLNEPAGKVASQVLKWVVPQLIACWDDERIDPNRTLNRIIHGVMHHPALREYGDDGAVDGRRLMFGVVERWWQGQNERDRQILRDQLSRDGVQDGRNHKEGVHDTGHGCGKPLALPGARTAPGGFGGTAAGAVLGGLSEAVEGSFGNTSGGYAHQQRQTGGIGNYAGEAVGGGVLGAVVGGLTGGIGADLLGGAFGEKEKTDYKRESYGRDGSYTQTFTETGRHGDRYEQAQYSRTEESGGGRREEFQRYEQTESGYGGRETGYGVDEVIETKPRYGGGYERTTDTRYEQGSGRWEEDVRREEYTPSGGYREETERYDSSGGYGRPDRGYAQESRQGPGGEYRQESREEYGSGGYGQEAQSGGGIGGAIGSFFGGGREEREEQSSGGIFGGGREDREDREGQSSGGIGGFFGGGREEAQEEEYQQEERYEERESYGGSNQYERREGYGDD